MPSLGRAREASRGLKRPGRVLTRHPNLDGERRALFWLLALGLPALSFVFAVSIAAGTWERVRTNPEKRTLRVTGSATKRIESDLIVWSSDIRTSALDRAAAYRTLHQQVEIARSFLIEAGVDPEDIRVSSVNSQELIDHETVIHGEERVQRRVNRGWSTQQTITVQSNDIPTVEKASREITSLLERGVAITSYTPSYHYTKLGELKVDMLAEASANAHERASRIVGAAGGAEIGPLWHADMGVINVNPANSTATSWEGNNDQSSFEKDVITIVHLTFELP